ncbi:ABC transporter permease subunit [Streptomyces antimicrobicus]|uniref:ABC transporter permease subunit n=1 Tax=Streptomyces antimicrobicus TaxID=2883108 RepID=A0ABS8BA46_9ACTN|nr:ABC transporter permease subunit [Streptomyces antimicrobicus]MCB5181418.1 ABC transporter permease subunit [Streptomyces antimicrobicus]
MSVALPTVPVLHSEWIKIRSLRGTLWALIAVFAATVGIQTLTAAAIGDAEAGSMGADPLLAAFYGLTFGQIAALAFGASAFAAEFHHGALRNTLAAVPDRTRFYLSKISMIAVLSLLVGEVAGFVTFVAGQQFMGPYAIELGAEGTVRAIAGCGVYLMLMALLAAGLTAMLRNSAAALAILIPCILILPFVVGEAAGGLVDYMPDQAGQMVMRTHGQGDLGPWTGLGVMALWSAAALVGGWFAIRRRDV